MTPKDSDPHGGLDEAPNVGDEWMVWRVAGEFQLSILEVDEWPLEDVLDANEYLDVQVDAQEWRNRYTAKRSTAEIVPQRLDAPR